MRAPARLIAAGFVRVAASEIRACVVEGELRPPGVLESAAPDAASGAAGGDGLLDEAYRAEHLHAEGIHPYLGFLQRQAPQWNSDGVMTLSQVELYRPDSPMVEDGSDDLDLHPILGKSTLGRTALATSESRTFSHDLPAPLRSLQKNS